MNPKNHKSSLAMLRGLLPFLAPYKKQFVLAGIALVVAAAGCDLNKMYLPRSKSHDGNAERRSWRRE